jgi:hypothetical protein
MREFAQRLRDTAPRPLTIEQILSWADTHYNRTGQWPRLVCGAIEDAPGETWMAVHMALTQGSRGLPGGSSLARLLAKHRGVRNPKDLPLLIEEQIVDWAEAHREQNGAWPNVNSGAVLTAPGEIWANIDAALAAGRRGLPGNSSLAKLLARERGVRNRLDLPELSTEIILTLADKHFQRTGQWPTQDSGAISDAPGETWKAVAMALIKGNRGLPGSSSLAQLLAEERGVRNPADLPPLTVEQILTWADAHFERASEWPNPGSGTIPETPGETWGGIHSALQKGSRQLALRSSLPQLLDEHRGVRNRKRLPKLSIAQILAWVDAHHERTGEWPTHLSGVIDGQPGETWSSVNHALMRGGRGLPGGYSIADVLARHRGVRNVRNPPTFTESQILVWAEAHRERTGEWPRVRSGPILECPDETWRRIDNALVHGLRGLTGGSSLARLIQEHCRASAG